MRPSIQALRDQVAWLAGMLSGSDVKTSDEWRAIVDKLTWLRGTAKGSLKMACEREANAAQQKSGG